MRKLLAIIPFTALLLAGCSYQEVVKVRKCVQIVGEKYYERKVFALSGPTYHYYVLADGREIRDSSTEAIEGRDAFGNICTTEYKPKK